MIRIDIWTGPLSQNFAASYHMPIDDPQLVSLLKRELAQGSLLNLLAAEPDTAALDFDNRSSGKC